MSATKAKKAPAKKAPAPKAEELPEPPEEEELDVVIDLDPARAAHIEANPIEYSGLKLYDRVWHLRRIPNAINVIDVMEGGVGAQKDFLLGYIRADERDDFEAALRKDEFLDEVMFQTVIEALVEQSTGSPTEESSS